MVVSPRVFIHRIDMLPRDMTRFDSHPVVTFVQTPVLRLCRLPDNAKELDCSNDERNG